MIADYGSTDRPYFANVCWGVRWGPGEWEEFLAAAHQSIRRVRAGIGFAGEETER